MDSELVVVTAAERPDLSAAMLSLGDSPWPEYLNHDAVTNALWPLLHELAPDYQFALLAAESNELVAIGNCIPIRWDGHIGTLPERGIDAVLEDGIDLLRAGVAPTAASALMVVVQKDWLGKGISARALRAMAEVVGRHQLGDLVAPVRPTDKQKYPLIEMTDYITWQRPDGMAFDPWIRVHERIGGRIARAASAAMRR